MRNDLLSDRKSNFVLVACSPAQYVVLEDKYDGWGERQEKTHTGANCGRLV